MRRQLRSDINSIFNRMKTLGNGSYMTFIYADSSDPWGTYETVDIVEAVPRGSRGGSSVKKYRIGNKKYTKKEVMDFMNNYFDKDGVSTMISLKDSQGNTDIFYNTDNGQMYMYN